jgi:hypothetical protein
LIFTICLSIRPSVDPLNDFVHPSICANYLLVPIHSPNLPRAVRVKPLESYDVGPLADTDNCLEADQIEGMKQLNGTWFIVTFVVFP